MLTLKGKTDAVMDWLRGWDGLEGCLKLCASVNADGDASMQPSSVQQVLTEFIDGRCEYEYVFDLGLMLPWSGGADDTNAEALSLCEGFIDWVNAQGREGSYPEWPGSTINSVGSVYAYPSVQVIQDQRRAKYSFQARITFIE